jgi:hypothetical protein
MRNRRIIILTCAVLLTALTVVPALALSGKSYGKALTGSDTVEIGELLANPDQYMGKTVRIEGVVTGVCEKRGCWISLGSKSEDFQEIRFKVDDGVIVFPMEAMGKTAIAEGTLVKVEMTLEQTVAYKQHHAEEHGEEFDPASVTEPLMYYQIKGSGAVIR